MTVAIDMRGLQTRGRFRGVGVHWREILRQLVEIDPESSYHLLYAKGHIAADDEISYTPNFHKVNLRVPFFPGGASTAWLWSLDGRLLSGTVRDLHAGIFVDTTFADLILPSRPVPGMRSVVWVYDLIPWLFSEHFLRGQRLAGIKKSMLRAKLRAAARADRVITSSKSTLQDFHQRTGYPLDRIESIPLGVDPAFFNVVEGVSEGTRRSIDLPERYIMFVGALDPHKNLARALAAYAAVRQRQEAPPLLIVGKVAADRSPFESLRNEVGRLGLTAWVRFLDWIPADRLVALYAAADYLLFPTLYEGFGLPALEAMAAGCPVLTSNTSSLPDVVGDCAVLVNPLDVESIAAGMIRLGGDPVLRARLSTRGRARAREFTWRRTAVVFLELLRGLNPSDR